MAKKKNNLTLEEKLQNALVPKEEQPYQIPENWVWTRLGFVSTVITGTTPSKKNLEYYGTEIPFFKPGDLDVGRHIRVASEYLSKQGGVLAKMIPAQSTAVCCIGTIGKSGFLEVPGATNQQINSAISFFNPLYQYYYMNTDFFVNQLKKKSSSTTISIVNKSKMEACYYPLPPIQEQKRIVERIESLFSKLDEAKEKIQMSLDSFETRKSAILYQAFSGELTKKWREENGLRLDDWEELNLNAVINKVNENFDPVYNKMNYRYIGLEHFEKNSGIIGFGLSEEVKSLKSVFRKGDILYGRLRPYLNKHAIAKFDGICSTDILVYENKENCISEYINFLMDTVDFIEFAVKNSKGINLPRVSDKSLGDYIFLLPSLEEQKEIVRILDTIFEKEQDTQELIDLIEKIDLMKKSILARAFRGELGTNLPEEESAMELLKSVLEV